MPLVDFNTTRRRARTWTETKFSEEVEKLQKTYEKLSKEKDETKERINDDDFKFAKAVKKAAAKASATDEL